MANVQISIALILKVVMVINRYTNNCIEEQKQLKRRNCDARYKIKFGSNFKPNSFLVSFFILLTRRRWRSVRQKVLVGVADNTALLSNRGR